MRREWIKKGTLVARRSFTQYLADKGFTIVGIDQAFDAYNFTVKRKNGRTHIVRALLGALIQDTSRNIDSDNYRDKFVKGNEVLQIVGFKGV